MLDLSRVTLFAIHVAFDKTKTAAQDFQDGEKEKKLDNGLEDTIRALYTCIESAKFSKVRFVTSKDVIDEIGQELLEDCIVC